MSLELLKEKFSPKHIAVQTDGTGLGHLQSIRLQYEEILEKKQKVIEKLENETHDLSEQISIFKKEQDIL